MPVIVFSLFASLIALAAFTLFVVLTYLPLFIALTSCLTFWDPFSTTGIIVFFAILPAPYNCPIASVILPAAVSAATSSDALSILPKVDWSKASLNLAVNVWSTGMPSSLNISVSSVPNVINPFGILIPALMVAPTKDSIRDTSPSISLPWNLSTILLIPLICSSIIVPVLVSLDITSPKKGVFSSSGIGFASSIKVPSSISLGTSSVTSSPSRSRKVRPSGNLNFSDI